MSGARSSGEAEAESRGRHLDAGVQEYYAATTRRPGVDGEIARRKVELFAGMDVVVLQVQHILSAIDLVRLHRLTFRDAVIIQADWHRAAECSTAKTLR